MAFPYVRAQSDWQNGVAGGTPINQAALDTIEAGIKSLSDILALVDAKGDLIVGSAADTHVRKAVGADNTVLAASAGETGGITWTLIGNAHVATNAAIARSKLATQTRRYPIHLHTPRSASLQGNSFWTTVALTDYDAGHWEFVVNVDGKAYGQVLVPSEISSTPAAKIVLVTAHNAISGVARWQVGTVSPANGETMNPVALADETAQDIIIPGTAYLRQDVTFALTTAPTAGDLLLVEVHHNGAHVNDTVAVNSLLFGAYLEVDVN